MWRKLRNKYNIISTWIDEAEIGQTTSYSDLWIRCIKESSNCDRLIVYGEEGDQLKGALIEVGSALCSRIPVFMVGKIEAMKTAKNHPLVRQVDTIEEALICP